MRGTGVLLPTQCAHRCRPSGAGAQGAATGGAPSWSGSHVSVVRTGPPTLSDRQHGRASTEET